MNINELNEYYRQANLICQTDEYAVRQRRLLHALTEYILTKDMQNNQMIDNQSDKIVSLNDIEE